MSEDKSVHKDDTTGDGTKGSSAPDSARKNDGARDHLKSFFTWERTIEIMKLLATVWVAILGSVVTMQFNERQHELNRIEAIAQMLPHMSGRKSDSTADDGTGADLGRDGAIWAIFRTASNRTMLRDLASLFPQDIYRVVSSIALTGELDHDGDAIVALQVASEKLASQYANDPHHAELADRLYAQAARLKERGRDDTSPLQIIDLTNEVAMHHPPTDDRWASLIKSINDLADAHMKDMTQTGSRGGARDKKGGAKVTAGAWEALKLYQRARQLGEERSDAQVQLQVMRADLSLAEIYVKEELSDDAFKFLQEALKCESKITGKPWQDKLKVLDGDGNGYASLRELESGVKAAQARLKEMFVHYADQGAELKSGAEPN